MIIGLFGFSFEDRNKGCEALTYSFISILNELIKEDLTIINLSGIGDSDKVARYFPNIKFDVVGFQKNKISLKSFISLLRCDIVFDCTFGDNFSDIYSLPFVSRTTNYKELALFFGKKFVLAPQTIGPFKDEKLKRRVAKVLTKTNTIFTRDSMSTECVRELSGREPITVTDLAFVLPYEKKEPTNAASVKKIGINVSGLLWNGGFDGNNQFGLEVNYRKYIDTIVKECIKRNFEVHFIPHVFSNDENVIDEDFKVCSRLATEYKEKCSPYFENPIEAKGYIAGMNIFVGARMHSTIAAFSSGVITIPFSYSRKFEGLFNSIGYNYIINARDNDTDEAITKTLEFIDNPSNLIKSQAAAMDNIRPLFRVLYNELEMILGINSQRVDK